jgi:hypothetical protein
MVVDPDSADDEEAGHVGGVCRPFMRQRDRKRLLQRVNGRHVQVQHEQGHGDGEDPSLNASVRPVSLMATG